MGWRKGADGFSFLSMNRIDLLKSNFQAMLSKHEHKDFLRGSVDLGRLAELMDRFAHRLEKAADTRKRP